MINLKLHRVFVNYGLILSSLWDKSKGTPLRLAYVLIDWLDMETLSRIFINKESLKWRSCICGYVMSVRWTGQKWGTDPWTKMTLVARKEIIHTYVFQHASQIFRLYCKVKLRIWYVIHLTIYIVNFCAQIKDINKYSVYRRTCLGIQNFVL